MFRDTPVERLAQNFLVLGIQPERMHRRSNSMPRCRGRRSRIGGVGMTFKYEDYFDAAPSTGYETLIYDCMIGDAMLYPRADGIEAGWRVGAAVPRCLARSAGRRISPSTAPAATVRAKPTNFCSATAAAGGRSRERRGNAAIHQPDIVVVEDAAALAEAAARRADRTRHGKDRAAICLTGGSTPGGLYRLLAEEPWREPDPWDRVHWFIGDDRFVPESDPLSNMGTARRLFLDRVGAPARQHPSDRDRCRRSGHRGAALRRRAQEVLRRRSARSGAAVVRSGADGTRRRRPHRVAVSALACTGRKRALGRSASPKPAWSPTCRASP